MKPTVLSHERAAEIREESAARVDAFLADFHAQTVEHPMAHFMRIWENRVAFEVKSEFGKKIRLGCIYTLERGKGHASPALDWLCALADQHQVQIVGHIKPVGDKPRLNFNQLRQWYKRHGFDVILRSEISRFPKE